MAFFEFYTSNLKLGSLYGVPKLSYVSFIDLYKIIIDSYGVIQFLYFTS